MDVDLVRGRLAPLVAGRKVVLAGSPLAGLTRTCKRLRELGAERSFLLATGRGTGPVPEPDQAEQLVIDLPRTSSVIDEIRAALSLIADLPAHALEALDRYDPDRRALVIAPTFNELTTVAGRRVFGPRLPAWRRLEDKVLVDELWDTLGVERAPSAVVPAETRALRASARGLDRGAGTAWAGDAREGFNGGATYLRWVRTPDDEAEAGAFLAAHCDRARVMPFLEGIPCSIHGIVFPDGVTVLRPVEMVTLRPPGSSRLRYCGAATFWDPPDADREAMRALARRVGAGLRARVGYRGGFTIDGVLAEEGFLPTELNSRFGAGLGTIGRSLPDLPLELLNAALVEGERLDVPWHGIEALLLEAADATRAGGAWTFTDRPGDAEHRLLLDAGAWRLATGAEQAAATLTLGPSNLGGFVRLDLDPARVAPGPAVAPLAAGAFAFADRELGTDLGPLEPARAVR